MCIFRLGKIDFLIAMMVISKAASKADVKGIVTCVWEWTKMILVERS